MSQDLVARALTALRQKNFAEALQCMTDYNLEFALEFQHYLIKGLAELALQDWTAARATFKDAVHDFPHQPQLWFNLGVADENLNRLDEAAESYEKTLNLKPDQADAYGNLSNIYRKQGRFLGAEEMAHRAFELGAAKPQALNALGLALGKQGKFEAAEKVFKEALRIETGHPDVLTNLANLYVDQLNFPAAWALFRAASALSDNASIRHHEGMARLLTGDFATGWPLYEARLEAPTALRVRPELPRWSGEDLVGKKLLLIAEQGHGDTIMFCRYGKKLAERGADLTWIVREPLVRLLTANLPGRVRTENEPLPNADLWLPLLSLPFICETETAAEAPRAPYLKALDTPELPDADGKLRIGLVWSGSPTHERDHERSIPLALFAPLWRKNSAHYFAPFTGFGLDQITAQTPVTRLDKQIKDFADTAALLAQMDSVITVDTAVAHLAGALGVKTYLLLPFCPDWRWGVSGEATPWYPSMTLIRQPKYGDWEDVIARLAALLT